jgi:hypothetical protein
MGSRTLTTFALVAVFSLATFFIGWQASATRLENVPIQLPEPCDVDLGSGGGTPHPPHME